MAKKREASEVEEQARIAATPSAQMQKILTRDLDPVELAELRASISDLKSKAARPGPNMLVQRRALSDLVIQAYDSGQAAMDKKDYIAALAYFDLAAVGSSNPAFAHYQRARTYAMSSHKKDMLAELRMALSEGFMRSRPSTETSSSLIAATPSSGPWPRIGRIPQSESRPAGSCRCGLVRKAHRDASQSWPRFPHYR